MKKLILAIVCLLLFIPAVYLVFAQEVKPPLKDAKPSAQEVKPPAKKASAQKAPIDKTLGETQFFCGYCHVLTYPEVMKKSHKTWKDDEKHNDIGCVECHYPPDLPAIAEHRKIPRTKAEADKEKKKKKTDWDFMKTELEVFSKLVTVLNMDESTVLRKPKIDDRGCTTSECHPTDRPKKKEGEYWAKKIKFTEYTKEDKDKTKVVIAFTHKEHYDKNKWVEGQEMHCATCHKKETGKKHFEVSKESCYLCHFKDTRKEARFGEDRAKCSLCHKISEEPFKQAEKPDEKPVTHKDYEDRKVSCDSCHLELVKGKGEIKEEKCLDCHENEKKIMKEAKNMKLMHKEHVAKQTASCFNCHEPIKHEKDKEFMFLDASLQNCKACHSEPHHYPKLLLAGEGGKGVQSTPAFHMDVKTNCLGCHTDKEGYDQKGRKVTKGSPKTCGACHTEKKEKAVKEWKDKVETELKTAREIEKEALSSIEKSKGKASEEKMKKVMAMLREGQENLRIIDAGGGVHNQKYSIMLIDAAMKNFEDLIDYLEKK